MDSCDRFPLVVVPSGCSQYDFNIFKLTPYICEPLFRFRQAFLCDHYCCIFQAAFSTANPKINKEFFKKNVEILLIL